jgi:hypothetical protein
MWVGVVGFGIEVNRLGGVFIGKSMLVLLQ